MKEEKSKLPGSETLLKLYLTKTAAEIGKETGISERVVRMKLRIAKKSCTDKKLLEELEMTAKNRQGKKPPLDKKRHRKDVILQKAL